MLSIYRHQHSPAEHFGRVGYDFLAAQITDWSGCPDEDAPLLEIAADTDRRVLALLLRDAPKPARRKQGSDEPREEMVRLAGQRIAWQRSLPELKVWAGQMSMLTIVAGRSAALADKTPDAPLVDWRVPLTGCCGIDARVTPNALDDGFSVAALGMPVCTFAACELLAILGMSVSPIVRYGYRCYGYVDPSGQWWQFRTVEREGHHRCYTMSQRVGINGKE